MPTVRRIKSVKWDEDDLEDYDSDDYSDSEDVEDRKPVKFTPPKPQAKSNPTPKREVTPKIAKPSLLCSGTKAANTQNQKNQFKFDSPGNNRYPLNVVVLGSVDAGKSTLLGHFLTLTDCVDKKLKSLKDFSWILDQGEDERDRGITIDPTKCQFNLSLKHISLPTQGSFGTSTRLGNQLLFETIKVNVIDTPGHHDLIPALVAGSVFANCAVVIADSNDVLKSDLFLRHFAEHLFILYFLGIRNVVVCVNKIDRFDYSPEVYEQVVELLKGVCSRYRSAVSFLFIPVSGLNGDNLVARSQNLAWFQGPSLIEAFQMVAVDIINRPVVIYDKLIFHVFDLWDSGKEKVSCSCFVEGNRVRVPADMNSFPTGVKVKLTSFINNSLHEVTPNSSPLRPSISPNSARTNNGADVPYEYVNDFVDCVEMKGTEIANLIGTKVLIDQHTHTRIKTNTSSIVITNLFTGFIYLNYLSSADSGNKQGPDDYDPKDHNNLKSDRLTIGQNVELFVGYVKQSAFIKSIQLIENTRSMKAKTVFSIRSGQSAFVQFCSNLPILVEPTSRKSHYIKSILSTFNSASAPAANKGDQPTARMEVEEHVGILSRLLVRSSGLFTAGGVIVN